MPRTILETPRDEEPGERRTDGFKREQANVLMPYAKAGMRTYEPRIVFQVKPLTTVQRSQLRTVIYIMRLLEARVRAEGSIRKAAKAMGCSKSLLGAVLKGTKPPGYRLARMVGYVPKTLYLRVWDEALPEMITGPKDKTESNEDH